MKRFLTLGAVAAIALPVVAQDTSDQEDWEVFRDPAKKSVIAYVQMSSGLTLAVRCVDGALDGVIAGLPAYPRDRLTRPLTLSFRDDTPRETRWSVTTDRTVAISDYPAAFARHLRKGGPLRVVVPDGAGDGRSLRHNLDLPPSAAAIEETLTACGRALEDPRDALLPDIEDNGVSSGLTWARPPRPSYPNTNFASGYAVVTCVGQPDGALAQCQVESQQPAKGPFGNAALRSTRTARLDVTGQPDARLAPRMIGFRISFFMAGHQPRPGSE